MYFNDKIVLKNCFREIAITYSPIRETTPQPVHTSKLAPTDPERWRTPLGEMKIPEPEIQSQTIYIKKKKLVINELYIFINTCVNNV